MNYRLFESSRHDRDGSRSSEGGSVRNKPQGGDLYREVFHGLSKADRCDKVGDVFVALLLVLFGRGQISLMTDPQFKRRDEAAIKDGHIRPEAPLKR